MSPPAGGGNSNNAANNRPPIACYNCGGPHFKSQCKEPTTGGPQARQQVYFLQQGMGDLRGYFDVEMHRVLPRG